MCVQACVLIVCYIFGRHFIVICSRNGTIIALIKTMFYCYSRTVKFALRLIIFTVENCVIFWFLKWILFHTTARVPISIYIYIRAQVVIEAWFRSYIIKFIRTDIIDRRDWDRVQIIAVVIDWGIGEFFGSWEIWFRESNWAIEGILSLIIWHLL